MAKFNPKSSNLATEINLAGGKAYKQSAKDELTFIALTSFVEAQFYRNSGELLNTVKELVAKVDPDFICKLAIYARTAANMRSITHVLIGEVVLQHKGTPKIRKAIAQVCTRPDDMSEIVAYVTKETGKNKLPAALRHGLKLAFNNFNSYSLGKYTMATRDWSLVDLINMVKPVPTEANAEALSAIVKTGNYKVDTWESAVSKDGSKEWGRLLREDKLGYMALLRNLRNIAKNCTEDEIDIACAKLIDPVAVAKSKQFPYRFYTAYKVLVADGAPTKLLNAVDEACDLAVTNAPVLENTLIAIDTSGSMHSRMSDRSVMTCAEVAFHMGAALFKGSNADLMQWATKAKNMSMSSRQSCISIAERSDRNSPDIGWGTNMGTVFEEATKAYDRIIILSDMASWVNYNGYGGAVGQASLNKYKAKMGCDPTIYVIDIMGYGTTQFHKKQKIVDIAGFSDTVFDIINLAEGGLISEIEKVTY